MDYQVLALKWRPQKFKDLIGQQHVARALQNSIKQNKLAKAYLFTGTRGIGKTSLTRIFSKAINCSSLNETEPCGECEPCHEIQSGNSFNYLEIDGASHNGVEHMRSLVESLQYIPTKGNYRIVVIDEVHMLSISAFNALLKTLEEPPQHVIFMFATTNPEKIPDTVLSRCQRFDLKALAEKDLNDLLQVISTKESLTFSSPDVLKNLAKFAKGSVRDALTLLEQLKSFAVGSEITDEDLTQSLGLASKNSIEKIVSAMLKNDCASLTQIYKEALSNNIDLKLFSGQVLSLVFDYTQLALEKKPQSYEMLRDLYLALSKEIPWVLKSLDPESLMLVLFQKQAFETVSEKKKSNTAVEVKPRDFILAQYLHYLKDEKPASAANLEMGNLLEKKEQESEFKLQYGFSKSCAVMYDFFEDKEILLGLNNSLTKYLDSLGHKGKKGSFEFELVEDTSFRSIRDIEVEKEKAQEEKQIESFKNHDFVRYTEEAFGAKFSNVKVQNDN